MPETKLNSINLAKEIYWGADNQNDMINLMS